MEFDLGPDDNVKKRWHANIEYSGQEMVTALGFIIRSTAMTPSTVAETRNWIY
jgi:hypothetical protein